MALLVSTDVQTSTYVLLSPKLLSVDVYCFTCCTEQNVTVTRRKAFVASVSRLQAKHGNLHASDR